MADDGPQDKLVEFLVHEADRGAGPGQPEAVPDWLDDNFWGRLADGLVGPQERRELVRVMGASPYVRRRAAAIAKEWPEALVGQSLRRPRQFRWRARHWGYALAAGLLVAAGVVFAVIYAPSAPPGPVAGPDLVASAQQAFDQGKYPEARELASRLLTDRSATAEARQKAKELVAATYFHRSRQLLGQGQYAEAHTEAQAGIDAGYDSVGLHHVLVCSELREALALVLVETEAIGAGEVATRDLVAPEPAKDRGPAIAACVAALKRYPQSAALWARLGRTYLASREYDKAIPALKKSLELDRHSAVVHNLLGLTYYGQQNCIEAARWFEAALGLAPDTPVLHYNLGRAYEEWEDAEGNQRLGHSLAHLERFLKLAPKSALVPTAQAIVSQLRRGGVQPAKLKWERIEKPKSR